MSSIASKIIEKCGGHEVIARWCGIDVSSVYKWTYPKSRGGTDGKIPSGRQEKILSMARKNEIPITPADFFDAQQPMGDA